MSEYLLNIFPVRRPNRRVRLSCVELSEDVEVPGDAKVLGRAIFEQSLLKTSFAELLAEVVSSLDSGETIHLPCCSADARALGFLKPVN